jgi:ATP-dependent Clp protease ATP-binding subunit ClpX
MAKSANDIPQDSDPSPTLPSEAILFLKLGESLSEFASIKIPDPYSNKSSKTKPEAELLKAIKDDTVQFKQQLESNSSLLFMRDLLRATLSEPESPPSDAVVHALALLAYSDFFCPSGMSVALLIRKLVALETSNNLLAKTFRYRKIVARFLENSVMVMDESEVNVAPSIHQWISGDDLLCFPKLDATYVQNVIEEKNNKLGANKTSKSKSAAINRSESGNSASSAGVVSSPAQLYAALKTVVIGQDEACKVLATRGWLHLKRAEMIKAGQNVGANENILCIGESGTGKSFLAQNFCQMFALPSAFYDSTSASAMGYVGSDIVEDSIKMLLQSAGKPVETALERARFGGVLFYDEFTKKSVSSGTDGRDINGLAVQQEMLRVMEGCKVQLGNRRSGKGKMFEFDTTGCMFLYAGFVAGFDQIIARLNRKKSSMGFTGESGHALGAKATSRDAYLYDAMVSFGFIPEFVNRLTKIVLFRKLIARDILEIATSPTGIIARYNQQLAPQGLSIKISDQGVELMAGLCVETGMMARGLRLFVGALVEEAVFEGKQGEILYDSTAVQRVVDGNCYSPAISQYACPT